MIGLTLGHRYGVAASLFALQLLACGARLVTGGTTPDGLPVVLTPSNTTVLVTETDPEALRAAVARSLTAHDWVVEESSSERIVARYTRGRVWARVALVLSSGQVVVTYLDSQGVAVESATSSRTYDRWMRTLSDAITEEVGRPERERLEAVARDEEAARAREREAREAEEREVERAREERLEVERLATERERLATERARAESAAAASRAREAEAIAHPRMDFGVTTASPGLGFDPDQARGGRGHAEVRPGFGSVSYRGRAGGRVTAGDMGLPAGCTGFFPADAQHTLVLPFDLTYLRLEAPSDGDATLLVVTPDGNVWCDDDSAGALTPRLAGWFPAGVYRVFVGSYSASATPTYRLTLSESDSAGSFAEPVPSVPTEFCWNLRAMEWLTTIATTAGRDSGADRDAIVARAEVVCGGGLDAASNESWGNGNALRNGSSWYYPDGAPYQAAGVTYYPHGGTFSASSSSSSSYYYPNAGIALSSSGTWYTTDGRTTSESALVEAASRRLTRERLDYIVGLYRSATNPWWRTLYVTALVVESER